VPTSGELISTTFGRASIFDMPPKKATVPGAALQPLDTNQDALSLREARNQKRKSTNPTLQEEQIDQEIRDLEVIHQQVQRKKETMARLADLQKKIDEAAEEMRHLTQDNQDRRCNTPDVYIPLDNEYGLKHVISVNKTDAIKEYWFPEA
jgi:hypothetical protein